MKAFAQRFARHRAPGGLGDPDGDLSIALLGPFLYPHSPFELVGQPFLEPFKYLLAPTAWDATLPRNQGARTSLMIERSPPRWRPSSAPDGRIAGISAAASTMP